MVLSLVRVYSVNSVEKVCEFVNVESFNAFVVYVYCTKSLKGANFS